jgi:hypothetical protein
LTTTLAQVERAFSLVSLGVWVSADTDSGPGALDVYKDFDFIYIKDAVERYL